MVISTTIKIEVVRSSGNFKKEKWQKSLIVIMLKIFKKSYSILLKK